MGSRKIVSSTKSEKTIIPSRTVELATEHPCQVYPRVSTPDQKKNVSAEMQQDKGFATLCGWVDDGVSIIVDTRDLGLSGQLKMEERPAFVDMLRRIASGTIKVVIAAQVDRLFRDRWGAEYSKFMEICYTYGVKVVTPNPWRTGIDFVYDFSVPWHIDKFRRKCEEAWSYLENHVYGRMLAAQKELGETGYWSGGSIPIGYIVDRREKVDGRKNLNYRKYIIYEPHSQVVRWLFERYRELAGQLNELMREIERRPYLFSTFDISVEAELITRYANKKVYSEDEKTLLGYTIASSSGLHSLLSNPAYVGYWIYNSVVVSSDNHKPIVDYGLFLYAFNRLSSCYLDGTPNEPNLEKRKRYIKKHRADKPALLKNHIESEDQGYTINTCDVPLLGEKTRGTAAMFYGFYPRKSGVRPSAKYMIPALDIDNFFLEQFIKRLQNTNEFDNFLSKESAEQQAQFQLQKDIERDIKAVEAQMTRIVKQIDMGELTNPELLKRVNTTYTRLQEDLARLRERQQDGSKNKNQANQRRTYAQMMNEAGKCWDELELPEEIPLMIDTFVRKVVIEPLSPRFYTISIYWLDPEWGIDKALCFRAGNPSLQWSKQEDELLKHHYSRASREELLQAIPSRSFNAMRHRAHILKLPRLVYEASFMPTTICWRDFQFMQEHSLTEEQLQAKKDGKLEKPHWTKEEDVLLSRYYPKASREELLQAIPTRNYRNMIYRAKVLGLVRHVHEQETAPSNASWQDLQVMQEYCVTEDQLWNEKGGKLIGWQTQPQFCTVRHGAIAPCWHSSAPSISNGNSAQVNNCTSSLIGTPSPPSIPRIAHLLSKKSPVSAQTIRLSRHNTVCAH